MSALEQEIITKLQRLDRYKKVQVLEFIDQIETHPNLTLSQWLDRARKPRAATREKYGVDYIIDAQSLLDELFT